MLFERAARLLHADKVYRQPASLLSRLIIIAIGCYGVWQGTFVALTSPERWSGPTYYVVKEIANYYLWAFSALFFGLIILVGSVMKQFYLRMIGHMALTFWNMTFCIGTIYSFNLLPTAGNTAPGTYAFTALIIAVMTCVDECDPSDVFYGRNHDRNH